MRIVLLLASIAALWVSPARAADIYQFTLSGQLTGTQFIYDCGPMQLNCITKQPFSMAFEEFLPLPASDFADGSQSFVFGNPRGNGLFSGTINALGGGLYSGTNLTYSYSTAFPCGLQGCRGSDYSLSAVAFNVVESGAVPPSGPNEFSFVALESSPVPEPATWAMMLVGFAAIGWGLRNAKHRPRSTYA